MSARQSRQVTLDTTFGNPEAKGASAGRSSSSAAQPAPGPGEAVTPALLRERWSSTKSPVGGVLGFYGHSRGEHRCFSNFYDQKFEPFDFEVPAIFLAGLGGRVPSVVPCEFSEKAIMLCKAAVMGDEEAYHKIVAATDPRKAKSLGRSVKGFRPEVWDSVVCSVAFQVVHQKFAKTPSIRKALLQTGNKLIAEATANDANWGIGINTGDPRVQDPSAWEGTNILGWALMEARSALRGQKAAAADETVMEVDDSDAEGAAPPAPPGPAPGSKRRWKH